MYVYNIIEKEQAFAIYDTCSALQNSSGISNKLKISRVQY